ncbi:unnamed protein product [Choristocarpus tenellus]
MPLHRYHRKGEIPSFGALDARRLPGYQYLSDAEALKRQHRFVRDEGYDLKAEEARGRTGADVDPTAWEVRMASKYYKLLFKEYALADLSRYREGKVGLRWRTEDEVVSGKGQFECGGIKCNARSNLHSYEINFKYKETGQVKNELVKVRVCPLCARKVFHKKIKELIARREKDSERERRRGMKAREGNKPHGHISSYKEEDSGQNQSSIEGSESSSAHIDHASEGCADHNLVLCAVEAGRGSPTSGAQKKKSRWDSVGDDKGGENSTIAPVACSATASLPGGGDGARVGGEQVGGNARAAWVGEVQKERTTEDEMDDYLSSLLF